MTPLTIVGIDLGKNWFHLVGLDEGGTTILRKKLNRAQLAEYAATAPRCIVATESCPGSQYWGRVFTAAGHEVRILPAQFVKPYLKANKNDFNDAAAIAEAGGRASMRYVPLKTTEQLELQALHRVRRRFIVERTAVINQMRALLLEHGMVIPVGRAAFVHRLPTIFTDIEHRLSPRLVELLHRLRQRWLALDVEIVQATRDLAEWADQSPLCRRAATVPGIGPIIAPRRWPPSVTAACSLAVATWPPGSDWSRASIRRAAGRRSDRSASAGTRTCASSSSKAPSPRSST